MARSAGDERPSERCINAVHELDATATDIRAPAEALRGGGRCGSSGGFGRSSWLYHSRASNCYGSAYLDTRTDMDSDIRAYMDACPYVDSRSDLHPDSRAYLDSGANRDSYGDTYTHGNTDRDSYACPDSHTHSGPDCYSDAHANSNTFACAYTYSDTNTCSDCHSNAHTHAYPDTVAYAVSACFGCGTHDGGVAG